MSRPPAPPARRAGFTLLELLTVIGVVSLLAALLIPAVQASREAARATDCRNRLKQFGLAIHNFASARGTLPPGNGPSADAVGGFFGNPAHVYLLAELDEGPLAAERERLRRLGPAVFGQAALYKWRDTAVATFRCPTDPASSAAGGTNYRLCAGASVLPAQFLDAPRLPGWPRTLGAFAADLPEGVPPSAIRDGLSQTAAVSEKLRGDGAGPFDRRVDAWDTRRGQLGGTVTQAEFLDLCRDAPADPVFYLSDTGSDWTRPGTEHTAYNHAAGPNPDHPDCDYGISGGDGPVGPFSATSDHPGGVNLLLLDGSVRFVGDAVDLVTWRALATRAGGETVRDF